jgi:hypothetical protein
MRIMFFIYALSSLYTYMQCVLFCSQLDGRVVAGDWIALSLACI